VETNPTRIRKDVGSIPGLTQWVKDLALAMSCGVGCRCGSDLALLWLWCRPAVVAPIRPLAWETPYAVSEALKRPKKKKKKKEHLIHFAHTFSSDILMAYCPHGHT